MKYVVFSAAIALSCGLFTAGVHAQTRDFDGGGATSDWSEAANWAGDTLPNAAETASIDAGGAWDVELTTSVGFVGGLVIGSDDELTASAGGVLFVNASWQNDGTLTMNGGSIINPSSTQTLTNSVGGLIRGDSPPVTLITDTLFNHGTIAPGFAAGTYASMALDTDVIFSSTSVVDIEIGGGSSGFTYDIIRSLGDGTTLGGTLQLTQFNGYAPDPSVSLVIMESVVVDGLSGAFDNVASGERLFTTDGSGSWQVNYGPGGGQPTSTVVITDWQPIPEPTTAGVFVAVLGLSLLQRRRSRA